MSTTLTLPEKEPTVVYAAIVAVLAGIVHVLVVTGVIPVEAEEAVAGVIDGVGALIAVLLIRRAVTPDAKVITRVTTDGSVVAGDAAAIPTGQILELVSTSGKYAAPQDQAVPAVPVKDDLVA